MGKYFGTDGFRGEANVNLTVDHAFKIGKFLGWYFGQEHKARLARTLVVPATCLNAHCLPALLQ